MTLADLIPSLRSSLPRRLEPGLWPSDARHLPGGDVAVHGVSLRELAARHPLPAVLLDDAGAITLCRVGAVHRAGGRTVADVGVAVRAGRSGDAAGLRAAHLLTRLSAAPDATVELTAGGASLLSGIPLPEDLRSGDVLALPAHRPEGTGCALLMIVAGAVVRAVPRADAAPLGRLAG